LLACKCALLAPLGIGFQFFYPLSERITRAGTMWTIELRIREFAYV
jgi:hypothetical protein